MDLEEIALRSGVPLGQAIKALQDADEVVLLPRGVAARTGNKVHLAAFPCGLGGRAVLRACRAILERWHQEYPVLIAPVRYANDGALQVAMALGFNEYGRTVTHIWLARERTHHG